MIKSPVLPVNDTALGANVDGTQTPETAVLLPRPPGGARRDLPDGLGWSPLQTTRAPASTFTRLS